MKTLEINSLSDLDEVADEILSSLGERSVVLFRGEMGAGKTTLISRIAARCRQFAAAPMRRTAATLRKQPNLRVQTFYLLGFNTI